MPTELGGPITVETVPVHYACVARYTYTGTVVQNDKFLRLSPFDDDRQTPGPCSVYTFTQGRQIQYPDRLGNAVPPRQSHCPAPGTHHRRHRTGQIASSHRG
jgi:hypothetical protein